MVIDVLFTFDLWHHRVTESEDFEEVVNQWLIILYSIQQTLVKKLKILFRIGIIWELHFRCCLKFPFKS